MRSTIVLGGNRRNGENFAWKGKNTLSFEPCMFKVPAISLAYFIVKSSDQMKH